MANETERCTAFLGVSLTPTQKQAVYADAQSKTMTVSHVMRLVLANAGYPMQKPPRAEMPRPKGE